LRNPRVGVDLADTGDGFVGMNEYHDVVLCGRACITVEAGIEKYVGFDTSDFQTVTIIP
jgi:hypothetical protein